MSSWWKNGNTGRSRPLPLQGSTTTVSPWTRRIQVWKTRGKVWVCGSRKAGASHPAWAATSAGSAFSAAAGNRCCNSSTRRTSAPPTVITIAPSRIVARTIAEAGGRAAP